MPDWLSHLGLAYIIVWWISKTRNDTKLRKYYAFFVIGMVAPDLERIVSIVTELIGNEQLRVFFGSITMIFHSLLGITIVSLFLTSFFYKEKDLGKIFITLFIGGVGHLFLDMIMWPWEGFGINWFYPLKGAEFSYSFHLVWPGGFVPLIITSIAVGCTLVVDMIQKNFSVFQYSFSKKTVG